MTDNIETPDFTRYTKDHWSFLLYVETVIVDHGGIPDHRRMNEADRDAADDMEADGLLVWSGTGANPVFSFTAAGWQVAHAIRRHRAADGAREARASVAALAFEVPVAIDECRTAMDIRPGEGDDAYVIREALRHARMACKPVTPATSPGKVP